MGRHFNCAQGWSREGQAETDTILAPACLSHRGPCRLCRDPSRRRPRAALDLEPVALPPVSAPAVAVGAFAVGALAIGALAIGALAIGGVEIRKARLRQVEIDSLTVRRFKVADAPKTASDAGPEP